VKLTTLELFLGGSLLTVGLSAGGCRPTGAAATPQAAVKPVYNKDTGLLEQLVADREGTGRIDMRAHMTGARVNSVEIDRNHDGRPDRWEFYGTDASRKSGAARSLLVRAEEANGSAEKVTRWEYYEGGQIRRVEEDTDDDGRVDKWEMYEHGALVRMDLDLAGRGFPDRRMVYGAGGGLERTEVDEKGDGRFKTPDTGSARPAGGRR
jgi:hypothetical protein